MMGIILTVQDLRKENLSKLNVKKKTKGFAKNICRKRQKQIFRICDLSLVGIFETDHCNIDDNGG